MPITALSKDTIRILGSAQALTTPVSLVKELIDNGLDARATTIDVSVSANTLDKIEVRDNGHGIDSGDFHALGKRGNTSKLRVFEDLQKLGGVTLGFRGEALGSAVELGEVTITTRTEGDAVAALLKLKAPDGVCSQTRTSHPVGTTVCVQNFLSRLPVRKQTALKETTKTLSSIKALLKSYALARPHVKFSFKVLKSGKDNWSFSPRSHDGIKEVVSQVIGRDLASQCVEISKISFKSLLDEEGTDSQETGTSKNNQDQLYEIHAFLPKPDADVTKICKGAFVSVDSRPVSCKRGTLKKIISIYKEHIRSSFSSVSPDKLKDPFIRLNIVCPAGSYDPNVEPAKDDVLFENESVLLSLTSSVFKEVYGEMKANVATEKKGSLKGKGGFDLLMARKPQPQPVESQNNAPFISGASPTNGSLPVEPLVQTTTPVRVSQPAALPLNTTSDALQSLETEGIPITDAADSCGKRRWGFSMGKDYEEPGGQVRTPTSSTPLQATPDQDDGLDSANSRATLNPWTVAKINAPVRKRVATGQAEDAAAQSSGTLSILPSPRQSSEPPLSAVRNATPNVAQPLPRMGERDNSYAAWVGRQEKGNQSRRPSLNLQDHGDERRPHTGSPNELRSSIAAWVDQNETGQQSRRHSVPPEDYGNGQRSQTTATQHRSRAKADFVVARDLPLGDPWTPPPTQPAAKRQRRNEFNKPFKAPKRTSGFVAVNDEERVQAQGSSSRQSEYTANVGRGRSLQDGFSAPRVSRSQENLPHEDLQYSLDFEKRKEDFNRQQRQEARDSAPRPSPHQNRYNAAAAVLDAVSNNVVSAKEKDKEPLKTSLPDGDPRAYLMRRQKSLSAIQNHPEKNVKLKRAKTMLLPLETVPDKFRVHNLEGTIKTDLYAMCKIVVEVIGQDEYLAFGTLGKAFDGMKDGEVESVREWLGRVSVERGLVAEGENVEFDLSGLRGQN